MTLAYSFITEVPVSLRWMEKNGANDRYRPI